MDAIKRRLGYTDQQGVSRPLYLETSSDMVYREDGTTLEQTLAATDAKLAGVDSKIANQVATAKTELTDQISKETSDREEQMKAVQSDVNTAKSDITDLRESANESKTSLEALVKSSIDGVVEGAPESLATLNKLATALLALTNTVNVITAEAPSDMDTFKEVSVALNTLAQTLSILRADSGDGSIKQIVSDAIALVIADAPESFDTLKEISTWILEHDADASAMNARITANANAITALTTRVTAVEAKQGAYTLVAI
ncbi:MAG: hypothetical protein NC489_08205 [Ruminococcus flavefaciens]|nr:hypothetical protein [Ruminococcus flavefaciens]